MAVIPKDKIAFPKLGGRPLRAVLRRKGLPFTPTSCTVGADGVGLNYKDDRPTTNAPRNPAATGDLKKPPLEAPGRIRRRPFDPPESLRDRAHGASEIGKLHALFPNTVAFQTR